MINGEAFIAATLSRGFSFFTGVPCSYLTPLLNGVIADPRLDYIGAASEGEAVAIASGAWLAGKNSVVMCQNSGLGNAINPLTSLNWPFRIPILMVVTWRGRPDDRPDEPQHQLMGRITTDLLTVAQIKHMIFPDHVAAVEEAIGSAARHMATEALPFALVLPAGVVAPQQLACLAVPPSGSGVFLDQRIGGPVPTRVAVLERMLAVLPSQAAVVATTGLCGRELYTLADREQHLYQVGSMGCASGMALGIALNTTRPVVVLDGDGAALMKLGTFATIGAQRPANLIHVLFDNGVHESTGGQPTVSQSVNFSAIALACGYRHACTLDSLDAVEAALSSALSSRGPHFVHVRVARGTIPNLGRPSIAPHEVARRFRSFLSGGDMTGEEYRSGTPHSISVSA